MKTIQCIIIRADAWCHYIMSLEISCLIPKFPIGVNLSYYWYFMISGWIRQVVRKNTYLVHVCFGVDWKQSIMHINFGLWKHHSPTGAGLIESSANNKFTNQNWYFSPCMQNSRNLSIMYISNKQLHTVTAV